MYYFGVKLKILPTFGLSSQDIIFYRVISLAFYPTAYIARLMRSSVLDVLGQDYMRTAKLKGSHSLNHYSNMHYVMQYYCCSIFRSTACLYIRQGFCCRKKIFTIPGLERSIYNFNNRS